MRNAINQLQFGLRERILGRFAFRRGPPNLDTYSSKDEERYYNLLLEQSLPDSSRHSIDHVIDIGCRNWSYINSLAQQFPHSRLTGVEIDARRRYWNLFRRIDVAEAYVQRLRQANRTAEFIPKDFRHVEFPMLSGRTLFCFLFPFLSENPCIQGGLPKSYADFGSLLNHSKKLAQHFTISPQWISIHQGEWEAEEARIFYSQSGLQVKEDRVPAQIWQDFWPSPYDSWIFTTVI